MPSNLASAIADKINKSMATKIKNSEYGIALRNYTGGFRGQGGKQLLVSNYQANNARGYAVFGKTQAGIIAP
jgi:hypothetical protein